MNSDRSGRANEHTTNTSSGLPNSSSQLTNADQIFQFERQSLLVPIAEEDAEAHDIHNTDSTDNRIHYADISVLSNDLSRIHLQMN